MLRQRLRTCRFGLTLFGLFFIATPGFAEYEVVEVHDGATIKGQAVWKGALPSVPPLKVFADLDTCGQQVPSPVLRIDPATKGVHAVLVYLERTDLALHAEYNTYRTKGVGVGGGDLLGQTMLIGLDAAF